MGTPPQLNFLTLFFLNIVSQYYNLKTPQVYFVIGKRIHSNYGFGHTPISLESIMTSRTKKKKRDRHVVRKHNTFNFAVPAFNNGLQKITLEMAISDLGSKFETIHNDMTGSGWAFQRADSIKIVMGKVEQRRIEKTLRDGKGALKDATLKDFNPYHRGWRGSSKVINFNYCNANFRERRDACEDWDKSSPCVMYALKIHSMYHNDKLADRDAIIKNLNNQLHRHYRDETLNAILETKVAFPPNFPNRGIQLKDISTLDRKNQIPIAVYYIRPPKLVDKK